MNKMNVMLLRMIKNSKGQFIAVLVIIIIGIAVYAALGMTSINMKTTLDDYYSEYNFSDLFLETGAVPEQRISALTKIDGVRKAQGRIGVTAQFITGNDNERVTIRIVSTNNDPAELNKSYISEGGPVAEGSSQVCVIKQFAHARGIAVGDTIEIQALGIRYKLEVAGIADNPEYIYIMESAQALMPDPMKFGVCYISEELAQQMAGISENYNEITLQYEGDAKTLDEDELIDNINEALDIYGVKKITKRKDQLSNNMIQEEFIQLETMSSSLPIVFLLVAGIILMMMLSRMVKRDRIKIGILKALGFSGREVMLHYVKYAIIAGAIGGTAGALLGMFLSGRLTAMYLGFYNIPLLRIEFYWYYVLLAILASIVFCALAGTIGARMTMKIAPADSMRTEAPKAGKRIFLERVNFFWKRLSFSQKMVWKNVFRNKKRTLFVLLGVALTFGMMLFTTSMPGAVDEIMNKNFEEFQKMDYNVTFQQPVKASAIRDLTHIIETDYIEPKLEYPFEIAKGSAEYTAVIIGLEKNTGFYEFENAAGSAVEIPTEGILLSENLAKNLNAAKGDIIQIKNNLPGKKDAYVRVANIIKQPLGLNAYMEIDYMGELLLEKHIATGAYVYSNDEKVNEKLLPASNIATIMSTEETREVYYQYMTLMILAIGAMVVFSGILGFCVVYNATIISIGEREMEFSSLRVLGLGKNEIFRMILNENGVIAVAGLLIGIPFGRALTAYSSESFSTNLYSIVMAPNMTAYFSAAALTVIFVVIAQLATYRKLQKLDFLQALKNRS